MDHLSLGFRWITFLPPVSGLDVLVPLGTILAAIDDEVVLCLVGLR